MFVWEAETANTARCVSGRPANTGAALFAQCHCDFISNTLHMPFIPYSAPSRRFNYIVVTVIQWLIAQFNH